MDRIYLKCLFLFNKLFILEQLYIHRKITKIALRLPVCTTPSLMQTTEQLGTMDVTIGLTFWFLCFLLPGGWILTSINSTYHRPIQH
uniref:Uncharacterized protein n=1 Tax=Prolemur simus TaxID=1328070 RepID=A0A8C9AGU9_PROSS